ncbi:aldo/keto reductase [Bacteroides helcogenes]|uniref:Aldo/keto reductase n=1 Tax=Bacteroides helcogenes (strain ATCC 35417 / DSM 20613 / JCM 6297 / CCUG 15421 / P 36-108) TaxID=693979 RepID=E6SU23_BACT6|nr:aldo/keto reductase [Bacteroides helcogenes]ADV43324.1 aldo/keto reductase [Bacteroides helcogenes P 36-108]MDY5238094.1 aldo/keto reductase [Bacteroides helcogenes]
MEKEKQERINNAEMNRRGFLKRAVLASAAICITPTLEKVTAAERAIADKPIAPTANIPTEMAAVRTQRILGSGKAALTISAMGFGCMGLNHHRSQSPDEKVCIQLVHEAIERGVTLFDTAESYGYHKNEILTGKALKGYTNRVFVSSKFGHKYVNGVQVKTEENSSPTNIRRVCENSLRNLGVETLGLFYQHRGDPNTPIEIVAETIKELIKEGKILHWGMCEVNAETIRRAHKVCPITAIQSEYHLMHRTVEENGVLALCEELGIGFVPYSPLNRGFLGGLINEYTQFDATNDNRQTLPRFQPDAIRQNMRIVEVLNSFGRTRGITPAQVALAWLMNKKPYIVPIPGTTKLSHLEENLRASEIIFTPEEMRELENAIAAFPVVGSRYDALQESKVQK